MMMNSMQSKLWAQYVPLILTITIQLAVLLLNMSECSELYWGLQVHHAKSLFDTGCLEAASAPTMFIIFLYNETCLGGLNLLFTCFKCNVHPKMMNFPFQLG